MQYIYRHYCITYAGHITLSARLKLCKPPDTHCFILSKHIRGIIYTCTIHLCVMSFGLLALRCANYLLYIVLFQANVLGFFKATQAWLKPGGRKRKKRACR